MYVDDTYLYVFNDGSMNTLDVVTKAQSLGIPVMKHCGSQEET